MREIKLQADTAIEAVGGYRLYGVERDKPSLGVMALAIQRDAHPLLGLGITQGEAKDNAKRMALCWNAFSDMPTSLIASMPGPVSDLATRYGEVYSEHKMLLPALVRLLNCPALNLDDLEEEDRMAYAQALSAAEACGAVLSK